MKIDDLEKVHPMKQVFWASMIQFIVVCLMLGSMVIIKHTVA
tara:strand:- start:1031 stop:1156 length:126 start_codon:yes stop_codon:yes gene_type:complete